MSLYRVDTIQMIYELELVVLNKGNELSEEEARELHDELILCYKEFLTNEQQYFANYKRYCNDFKIMSYMCSAADVIQKKTLRLQKILRQFFSPVESTTSTGSKVINDTSNGTELSTDSDTTVSLESLLQKQIFYIQMIDSLEPINSQSSKEAELQYKHVSQFYEKFISNQSEIMTLVKDAPFDDQVTLSKEVQRKVISIQASLEEIFSPVKTTPPLVESKVNEHFSRTERPRVIADFLDSLYKKQKHSIEQIEIIESKNDLGAAEAETLHNHVSQLHESFTKNQAKIETYVNGSALDSQLQISGEILQKVMSLQTKLKEVFAPVASPSSKESMPDESNLIKESDKVVYLNWLLEKQKSLIEDIKLISLPSNVTLCVDWTRNCDMWTLKRYLTDAESKLKLLREFKEWFLSNQTKIETFLSDYDLYKQKRISSTTNTVFSTKEAEFKRIISGCTAAIASLNQRH